MLSRTTVERVTNLELKTDENVVRCNEFDKSISAKVGDAEQFIDDGKGRPIDWAESDDSLDASKGTDT